MLSASPRSAHQNDRAPRPYQALADGRPAPQGLYDSGNEHDACGVGFVATLTGTAEHRIVEQALTVLRNLEPVSYTHLTLPTIYSV